MAEKLEEVRMVEDPDNYDPEEVERLRASNMMPRWGQLLAWVVWELPWALYLALTVAPLLVWFQWTTLWKVLSLTAVLGTAVMAHARSRVRNPFRTYVLVTRRAVPGAESAP